MRAAQAAQGMCFKLAGIIPPLPPAQLMKIALLAGRRETQAESGCRQLLPEPSETLRLRQPRLGHASPAVGRLPMATASTGPVAQLGHRTGNDSDTGAAIASHQRSPQYLPTAPVSTASPLLRGTVPRRALRTALACLPASRHSHHVPPPAPRSARGLLPPGPGPAPPPRPSPHRPLRAPGPLHPPETRVGRESRPHLSVRSPARRSQRGEHGVTLRPWQLRCGCTRAEARPCAPHSQRPHRRRGGTGKPTATTAPRHGTARPAGAFCFTFRLKPAPFYFGSLFVRGLLLQLPAAASSHCPTD